MDTTKASAEKPTSLKNQYALGQMENIALGGHGFDPVGDGHKFGLPDLPIPPRANLHHRYEPVISQVTNLLMKHGKLSVAQRVGSSVPLFHFVCIALLADLSFVD
jgi:small subunit ribosomal protein S7